MIATARMSDSACKRLMQALIKAQANEPDRLTEHTMHEEVLKFFLIFILC